MSITQKSTKSQAEPPRKFTGDERYVFLRVVAELLMAGWRDIPDDFLVELVEARLAAQRRVS
jgi:hypothetical protein